MSIWTIIDFWVSKLTISNTSVHLINIRGSEELHFTEIKGIKSDHKFVYVIPKNAHQKMIKIHQFLAKRDEWYLLLYSKFHDIERFEIIKEKNQLYADQTFGKTSEERTQYINQVKRHTKLLNYASWATAIWLFFYPKPYELATSVGIILPLVGLFWVYRSKGLIKIFDIEKSPYPSLSTTLSIPSLALTIRMLYDFNILEYTNAWRFALLFTPIVSFIILKAKVAEFKAKSKSERIQIHLFLVLTIGLFSFMSSIMLNCAFDQSIPQQFTAIVTKKKIEQSRHGRKRYVLTLGAWGTLTEQTEVSVSERQYKRIEEGASIDIYLKKGLLHIPWVYASSM